MPLSNDGLRDPRFEVTRWSKVLAARGDGAAAREALAYLCTHYWYPVYVFVRRQRNDPHDAEDLTQAFFEKLLEKERFDGVAQENGKFRAFLLASMKHFMANNRDRERAQKRGGGRKLVSLDTGSAESRYAMEPVDHETPERIFDRRWALTLLDHVLSRLRSEMAAGGREPLYEELKSSLTGQPAPYAEIAGRLGTTEGAVKVAAHRLRRRYRELVRLEVAQTVGDDEHVDEELRDLMAALRP